MEAGMLACDNQLFFRGLNLQCQNYRRVLICLAVGPAPVLVLFSQTLDRLYCGVEITTIQISCRLIMILCHILIPFCGSYLLN